MKASNKRLVLLAIGLLTAGCAGVPAQLGTPMTASVPTGPERAISARGCGFQLLLFFPININDRMQRAVQLLELQANGDFITDVKVTEKWTYAFVGTVYCTTLEATAIGKPGSVQGGEGFPRRLDMGQAASHFAAHPEIQANLRNRPFTLTKRAGEGVERTCDTCPIRFGVGTMVIGEGGRVCFQWPQRMTYPGSGCYELIQASEFAFRMRGLEGQATIEYSVKPQL
jgi:hypothetical protein